MGGYGWIVILQFSMCCEIPNGSAAHGTHSSDSITIVSGGLEDTRCDILELEMVDYKRLNSPKRSGRVQFLVFLYAWIFIYLFNNVVQLFSCDKQKQHFTIKQVACNTIQKGNYKKYVRSSSCVQSSFITSGVWFVF